MKDYTSESWQNMINFQRNIKKLDKLFSQPEDGEKETIRKVFKKLTKKKRFKRRWIEKFLNNREGDIEDSYKNSTKIICLNSIFYGIDHIYKN